MDAIASHCNPDEECDGNASTIGDSDQSRYEVSRDHTRDSTMKQWTTTKVLILQGIDHVFRMYFQQRIGTSECVPSGDVETGCWFIAALQKVVRFSFQCSIESGGRATLDIRTAGLELLSLCCQVWSKAGVV